jgi:pSer/pThr/pTyr-binding forkhead associated (FHA) protein
MDSTGRDVGRVKLAEEDLQEIRFTVVKGSNPGSRISFPPGTRTIRIGRALDNEIVIADPTVSRFHARVELRNEGYYLADLGSTAGVEKMGFRLGPDPEPLESGDEFRLGDSILRFEIVAKKGATQRAAARQAESKAPSPVPALQRILHRLGLRSRTTQLGAAALAAVLVALLAWPTPPQLPPQAAEVPLAVNYNAVVGYNNVDPSHLDKAIFEVPADAEGVVLYYDLLPISGVEIRTSTRPIGRRAASDAWEAHALLMFPRAMGTGGKVELVFDNLGYAAEQGAVDPAAVRPWAIKAMWLARIPRTATSPLQLAEEVEALRTLHGRLADDPGNLYKLVQGIRQAALGTMKVAGRAALLVVLPAPEEAPGDPGASLLAARRELESDRPQPALDHLVAAARAVEGELGRRYRREINAIVLARKKGSVPEELQALLGIVKLIPDAVDPRHRQAASELQRLGYHPEV